MGCVPYPGGGGGGDGGATITTTYSHACMCLHVATTYAMEMRGTALNALQRPYVLCKGIE